MEDPENFVSEPRVVFCRILRSKTVMVRIGGGWQELASFITQHFSGEVDISVTETPRGGYGQGRKISTSKVDQEILEANSLILSSPDPSNVGVPRQRLGSRVTPLPGSGTGLGHPHSPLRRHNRAVSSSASVSPVSPEEMIKRPRSVAAVVHHRSPGTPTPQEKLRAPLSSSMGRITGKQAAQLASSANSTELPATETGIVTPLFLEGGKREAPRLPSSRMGMRGASEPPPPIRGRGSLSLHSMFHPEPLPPPAGSYPKRTLTPSRIPTPVWPPTSPIQRPKATKISSPGAPSRLASAPRSQTRSSSHSVAFAPRSPSSLESRIPRLTSPSPARR